MPRMITRKIDLYLSRAELEHVNLNKNQVAVIIDVLRASTSIITALANGCKAVIPVEEVDDAFHVANKIGRQRVLLGGERNEKIIQGFDLSNSPLDYCSEKVKGKIIVFTSTNGAQLFEFSRFAKQSVIGGFVNQSRVASFLSKTDKNVVILCAGKNRHFGLEDAVCGGMIIHEVISMSKKAISLNDGAVAAKVLFEKYANNFLEMLHLSMHGQRLIAIGQEKDLQLCSAVDSVSVLPLCQNGKITLADVEAS